MFVCSAEFRNYVCVCSGMEGEQFSPKLHSVCYEKCHLPIHSDSSASSATGSSPVRLAAAGPWVLPFAEPLRRRPLLVPLLPPGVKPTKKLIRYSPNNQMRLAALYTKSAISKSAGCLKQLSEHGCLCGVPAIRRVS